MIFLLICAVLLSCCFKHGQDMVQLSSSMGGDPTGGTGAVWVHTNPYSGCGDTQGLYSQLS